MSDADPVFEPAVTIAGLKKLAARGGRFACLTAYDASFARLLDQNGVDVVLVGDSLGMVVQGHASTVPVSMDDMVYHCRAVSRGLRRALLMVDMPFMSYATVEQALENAARLMRDGRAHMVKLEGGRIQQEIVSSLTRRGIPVCAHLGLQPQSVYKLGGYRVQGRSDEAAQGMLEDALALQDAGADMLLLECVPRELASHITGQVGIPVIGIGAGPDTHAQVLVLHDMLGATTGRVPRFAADFLTGSGSIAAAIRGYVEAVREGRFPAAEHCY